MAVSKLWLAGAAMLALGACETMPAPGVETPAVAAAPDAYSGKSVLDAAIAAAGGEAALGKVKEVSWTGTATVNAEGKTTEIELQTFVRPLVGYARTTSWPKADGKKAARTIQAEGNQAWTVTSVSWNPMSEAQAAHEIQQFAVYGAILLTPLKAPGVTVTETAPGKDGTRNLHVESKNGPPMDLRFNAAGKLIQIADSVRDPKGGATPIPQVMTFEGEVVSNGVKWPKRITIAQNGAPYFDLNIATFEARPDFDKTPIEHTLGDGAPPPGGAGGRPG